MHTGASEIYIKRVTMRFIKDPPIHTTYASFTTAAQKDRVSCTHNPQFLIIFKPTVTIK